MRRSRPSATNVFQADELLLCDNYRFNYARPDTERGSVRLPLTPTRFASSHWLPITRH